MARTDAILTPSEIIAVEELDSVANSKLIYKDGTGAVIGLGVGTNLSVVGGDLTATGGSGSGDVVGPASATDGAPALFDGPTGKLLKNSTPTGTGNPVLQTSPTLVTPVINGLPTGTGVSSASTASTLVARDANKNIFGNNIVGDYTTTATAAGTTTLTAASTFQQFFTGTTTQTVVLPVTSTLTLGHAFAIKNNSTGAVTVNSSGGNAVLVMAAGSYAEFVCILTSGTTAASWNPSYQGTSVATGKKLSVSNSLTLTGTDGSSVAFGAGGTVLYSGGALGTPSSGTLTNCTFPTLNQDTTGKSAKTDALQSATTTINISSAAAPSSGQVLTATSSTSATWQTPASGADIGCRVKQSSTQSIGTTLTAVIFDAETYDTDSMHSTVTNNTRITFNTAGKYIITSIFNSDANVVGRSGIRLNGTTYIAECAAGNAGASLANGESMTTIYSFSASDYIELMGYFGTTQNTKTGENGTQMCVQKIA